MGDVDQEAGVVQEEEEKEEVRRCGRGVAIQSSRRSRKRKRQSRQKDRYGSLYCTAGDGVTTGAGGGEAVAGGEDDRRRMR